MSPIALFHAGGYRRQSRDDRADPRQHLDLGNHPCPRAMRIRRAARENERFEREFWKAEDIDGFFEKRGQEDCRRRRSCPAGLTEWRRSTAGQERRQGRHPFPAADADALGR
jgi:hypothetical protein